MDKKTERKNKKNLVVNWPTTPFFTINDILALNDAKPITLRVRLAKQIEAGKAIEIGCKTGGQGRPKKVFAFTPIADTTFELAKAENIILVDENRLKKMAMLPSVTTRTMIPVIANEPVTA